MCSEMAPPRLSFSNDLSDELQDSPLLKEEVPRKDTLLLDSENNNDFEFSTTSSSSTLEFETCSADEIFSNGVMLPIQIQDRVTTTTTTTTTRKHTRHGESPYMKLLPPRPSSNDRIKKDHHKRELALDHVNNNNGIGNYDQKKTRNQSKSSFWGFGRSKSLNCDTKKSFICSLPPLSRSNSTGSVANPKRASSSNKNQSIAANRASISSCSSAMNLYPVPKSPSGKGYGGSYANDLRISPVLNVPSANLFGFGSFLRVGKVKKSKN